MSTNSDSNDQNDYFSARRIVDSVIPEDARLARITDPGYLEALATRLGVRGIRRRSLTQGQGDDPGVDAMLIPLSDGYTVVINDSVSASRQRYSLAHELGHIFLLANTAFPHNATKLPRYRSGDETGREEERLCDEIAAEILMPERLFKERIESEGKTLENLPKWANLFRTSLTSTAIRYRDLLPEPCHQIKWRKSVLRRGVIRPAWQKRNRVPGPSLQPGGELSQRGSFRVVQESWTTLRNHRSLEALLVRYWKGNRAYLDSTTFETESIGFGGPKNRTVLSTVYLGRNY